MSHVTTNIAAAFVAVLIATATIVPVVNVPAADYSTGTVLTPELA